MFFPRKRTSKPKNRGELEGLREDLKESDQPSEGVEELRLELPGSRSFSRNKKTSGGSSSGGMFDEAKDAQPAEVGTGGGRSSIGGPEMENMRILLEEAAGSGDVFGEEKRDSAEGILESVFVGQPEKKEQEEEEWGEFQEGQKESENKSPEHFASETATTPEKTGPPTEIFGSVNEVAPEPLNTSPVEKENAEAPETAPSPIKATTQEPEKTAELVENAPTQGPSSPEIYEQKTVQEPAEFVNEATNKFIEEYASNNYWRSKTGYNIADLAVDYS